MIQHQRKARLGRRLAGMAAVGSIVLAASAGLGWLLGSSDTVRLVGVGVMLLLVVALLAALPVLDRIPARPHAGEAGDRRRPGTAPTPAPGSRAVVGLATYR